MPPRQARRGGHLAGTAFKRSKIVLQARQGWESYRFHRLTGKTIFSTKDTKEHEGKIKIITIFTLVYLCSLWA